MPLLAVAGSLAGGGGASAGSAVFGVDYYISAPLVQGSYVTAATGGILEEFNGASGACPSPLAGGITWTGPTPTSCSIVTPKDFGGASTSDSVPTIGGSQTNFATTFGTTNADRSITFSMSEPQKYLGFWWSAGSSGNVVTFFSGSTQILQLTTDTLFSLLGTSPTISSGSYPFGTTGSLTAVNDDTYLKHHYFANPVGYTSTTLDQAQWDSNSASKTEPFVYLHVFSQGGMTFDSVVFSGPGFEFDNFVVSPLSQDVDESLVYVGSEAGTAPRGSAPFLEYSLEPYFEQVAQDELPDTGRDNEAMAWLAAGLVAIGGALVVGQRRIRRL